MSVDWQKVLEVAGKQSEAINGLVHLVEAYAGLKSKGASDVDAVAMMLQGFEGRLDESSVKMLLAFAVKRIAEHQTPCSN